MNDSEKQTIVFIPRNFIEKGTFMGGMFKIRNAIEGGILAVTQNIVVVNNIDTIYRKRRWWNS